MCLVPCPDQALCILPIVQEENNSVHSQKVDILQKMLSKEQQDLQVSILSGAGETISVSIWGIHEASPSMSADLV